MFSYLLKTCIFGSRENFGSMRLTHKKTVFSHKLCTFFEAVNYHTKKTKKTKQSAFHTDLSIF